MIKEYMASVETEYGLRHQLTKYTLSNGVDVILNEDEIKELFKNSKLGREMESLKAENMKLAHQKKYYKDLIKNFSNILTEMKGV